MRHATLVYNPSAGRQAAAGIAERTRLSLESAGWSVAQSGTTHAGHATEIARRASRRTDAVVVIGGDGTLREVAEGVLCAGRRVAVGLIPAGNANVVARGVGIPLRPDEAIARITDGKIRPMDTMEVNGRVALAMVGVGFDGQITSHVARWRQSALGRYWYRTHADSLYALMGIGTLLSRSGRRLTVSLEGSELPVTYRHVIISNLHVYGKGWSVSPSARPSDGVLRVQLRRRSSPLTNGFAIYSAARSQLAPEWVAVERPASQIELAGIDRGLLWQIDGDPMAEARRIEIAIQPSAIRIFAR